MENASICNKYYFYKKAARNSGRLFYFSATFQPMNISFSCLLILLCFGAHKAAAQKRSVDSLKHLLASASGNTSRISLSYLIGIETKQSHIGTWDSLLEETRKYDLPLYESRILGKMGSIYSAQGLIQEAVIAYQNGLAIAEKNGYKTEMLDLYKRLEVFYAMQLDRKRSLYYNYKGLRLAEELHDKKAIADFYSSLAVYYLTSDDFNKALKMHFLCLKKCREIGYETGIAGALLDIGSAYAAMGQHIKMIPYYRQSLQYIHALTEPVYAVQVYNAVSESYRFTNQLDSAYLYGDSAYQLAIKLNNKRAIASSLVGLGRLDHNTGKKNRALLRVNQALELATLCKFNAQLPSIYLLLRDIHLKEQHYYAALKEYERYINIRDSLSNEQVRKQALEKEFEYNLGKKENEYRLLAQQNQIQYLNLKTDRFLFIGLGVLFCAILMITALLIRQNKLQTAHQQTRLEQKLLRSQMNPHFVFNSLNSIQQLIMKGQNTYAELYLSRFSQLIRDLLESNTRENLTVEEEINMLKAYLEIESLRFGGRFSHFIHTDERIDIHNTCIPHLMIQPFVENAIWHGLLGKDGDRTLNIRLEYDSEKTIRCIVDDNGIGREASKGKGAAFRKRSLALSLVDQRIELLKKAGRPEGSIRIIDKKEGDVSTGTTVIITLPILKH
jgi:tetratricopeptide (TPR) repeat protein/two-component sensor histidine kinase